MIRKLLIMLPLSFLMTLPSLAQEADSSVVVGKNRIVYKGRIYKQNAPYVSFGYGAGFGFESQQVEQNMTLSYQHFIKGVGLRIGYHSSSDTKIWWRSYQKLNDLFIGVGHRWETNKINLAVFGGPTFAYGSYVAWNEEKQKDFAYGFNTLGGLAEVQLTYKLMYDLGVGLSVYGSVNRYYSAAGAQIHLYFSTAFVSNYL
jgi:hypothetical protein